MTEIKGRIGKIVFKSPNGGFFIFGLDTSAKEQVTVKGKAPALEEGWRLTAQGQWEDSKWGRQFSATKIVVEDTDPSEVGILSFLQSGYVAGIGPKYANLIVEAFGDQSLNVLLTEPHKISGLKGFGPARVKTIIDSVQKNKDQLNTMIFLSGLGVGEKGIIRVQDKYGKKTESVIRENPYILCDEENGVERFGFKTADKIALKMGIGEQSEFRIKAALVSCLADQVKSGSTGAEGETLVMDSFDLMESVPYEAIEKNLEDLLKDQKVVSSRGLYFNKVKHFQETYIAKRLLELKNNPSNKLKASKVLERCDALAKNMGITLDPAQTQAVVQACTSSVHCITGRPGAGKTTITKIVVDIFKESGLTVGICAPTGKAAKRASESIGAVAVTMHRLLGSGVAGAKFAHNKSNPLTWDVVIVDESSMTDVEMMYRLVDALKKGAILILIGDSDQLPSVGAGNVLYDIVTSKVITSSRLNRVFRQGKGSPILDAAYAIGDGKMPQSAHQGELILKFFPDKEDASHRTEILDFLVANFKKLVSEGFDPVQDIQVLAPMNKGILGVENLNSIFQKLANPNPSKVKKMGATSYGVGDKVIQNRNNYDVEVFNGEIGYIKDIDFSGNISIKFDGKYVTYSPSDYHNFSLAYALTIHRSQGSECPAVIMPLDTSHFMMLKRNTVYTGVTRAKKKLILAASPKAMAMAINDPGTESRITDLGYLLSKPEEVEKQGVLI